MVSLGKAGYLVEENAKNPGVLKTMAESRIGCFPLLFALENKECAVSAASPTLSTYDEMRDSTPHKTISF